VHSRRRDPTAVPRLPVVSAGDVDVDGLVGHGGDKVVVGSRHTGVGPQERLARANRAERALVHRSGVDPARSPGSPATAVVMVASTDDGPDGAAEAVPARSERGGRQRAAAREVKGSSSWLYLSCVLSLMTDICYLRSSVIRYSGLSRYLRRSTLRVLSSSSCGFGCLPGRNSQTEETVGSDRRLRD
jgi:hypothetical protein